MLTEKDPLADRCDVSEGSLPPEPMDGLCVVPVLVGRGPGPLLMTMVEVLPSRDLRPCRTSVKSPVELPGLAGVLVPEICRAAFASRLERRDELAEGASGSRCEGGADEDEAPWEWLRVSVETLARMDGAMDGGAEGAGELCAVERAEMGWTAEEDG